MRLSAGAEAIAHYKKALELLKKLPETPQRDQQELALQLALAVPLMSTRALVLLSWAKAVVRARELCDRMGDTSQRFNALFQLVQLLWNYRPVQNRSEIAGTNVSNSRTSQRTQCSRLFAVLATLGLCSMWENLSRSIEYAKHLMDVYNPEKHGFMAYLFGYDVGVFNLGIGSWAQWILGYPDQALRQLNEAVNIARKLGHPHSLAFVLLLACELNWFLGNFPRIDKDTEELVPLLRKEWVHLHRSAWLFLSGGESRSRGKSQRRNSPDASKLGDHGRDGDPDLLLASAGEDR